MQPLTMAAPALKVIKFRKGLRGDGKLVPVTGGIHAARKRFQRLPAQSAARLLYIGSVYLRPTFNRGVGECQPGCAANVAAGETKTFRDRIKLRAITDLKGLLPVQT